VIFDVAFSQSGLKLESYTWGGSFNGSGFDNTSDPTG
jgi:hypothetical protein